MAVGQAVKVLVATQSKEVYEVLRTCSGVECEVALYTGTIKELLPQVQLIIIDYEDIVEYPFSEADIREEIFAARVFESNGRDFCSDPARFLSGVATSQPGKMLAMPEHYCIAFASYSGGVGRTTLALDTALHYAATMKAFREKRGKQESNRLPAIQEPALLVELTYGVSSLAALTGIEMPYLYQLVTQPEANIQEYKEVGLVPMDYENVRMLSVDLLQRYIRQQRAEHSLTVVDCLWPHGLANALAEQVDLWIVVASGRPDTIANARKLHEQLNADFHDKVWMLLNQSSEAAAAKDVEDLDWAIKLRRVARPDDYRGELGRQVLASVFSPIWEDYANPRKAGARS
jgi:hypothetical protein